MNMKRTSIKLSILIPSLAVLIAGIILTITVVGVLSSNTANDLTNRLIEARVNEYTNEFKGLCNEVYGTITASASIISNYTDPDYVKNVPDPRGEAIGILSKILLSNDKIVTMWTCWEPDAFDGKDSEYANTSFYDATGRFIPYIYKDGNSFKVDAIGAEYNDPVEGEYYHAPLRTGKPYITDPYICDVGGRDVSMYTIAIPIFKNGKVAGVVGADIDLQDAITIMNSGSILDDGYLFTLSPGGLTATHSNKDLLMKRYETTWLKSYSVQIEAVLANGGSFDIKAYSDVINENVAFLGSGVKIGDIERYWIVCGVVPEKTVKASSTMLLKAAIAIGFALILVVGATILLIVRNRLQELPLLTATSEAIAAGDIDSADLDAGTEETKNEISLLSRAFSKMAAGIRQQADVLSQISQGDYSMTVSVRSDKDVMNRAISHMLGSTNGMLKQISSTTSQVSTVSKQIADGAQSLAQGATEQAATMEELAASISEVADKTSRNADIAKEAAELSDVIRNSAEKGSGQMEQMMEAVKEINDAGSQIGKVIKVIDDIAFQTNILALNAAVEAARAGTAGKGFAVVAAEVRKLAAKSAEAAKDTGVLIENSIEKSNLGFNIAMETSVSLKEIVDGINHSAEIIARIAQLSEEQSESIGQINIAIDQVAEVIQQNSATAEESAAVSEQMSGQSDMLAEMITKFTLKDTN